MVHQTSMLHQASMIHQANMIHQPLARCCSLSNCRALSLSRSRATSPPKLSCVPQDTLNAASHQPISPSLTTVKVRLLICVSACPELSCASGCIECRECTRDYSEGTLASVAPILCWAVVSALGARLAVVRVFTCWAVVRCSLPVTRLPVDALSRLNSHLVPMILMVTRAQLAHQASMIHQPLARYLEHTCILCVQCSLFIYSVHLLCSVTLFSYSIQLLCAVTLVNYSIRLLYSFTLFIYRLCSYSVQLLYSLTPCGYSM